MNPTSGPGLTPDGRPMPPQQPAEPVADISEDAFGFADVTPPPLANRPVQVPARPVQPTPQPPVPPTPQYVAPAPRPPVPATPAVQPPVAPLDIMPPPKTPAVPVPLTPPPAQPAAQPTPAVPPIVPTPPPPAAPAPTPLAAPPSPPAPQPPAPAPIKLGADFDPRAVPVHASSTSENPITATYTPIPTTHLPDDIAKRISEHPMQNSEDVLRLAKHGFDIRRLKSIVSFLFFTAGIFIAAFLINQFIFQSYYVEGSSMIPTLHNNDRLIISKVERTLSLLQGKPYIPDRGQIVVFDSTIVGLNGHNEQLIKRVIGLPGDHIHIEGGVVTIKNAQHPEGYDITKSLGLTNLQPAYTAEPIDLIVPAGHLYVIGDNREQGGSQDSRVFGPIDSNKIQGRLWARILPLDKAQLF